MKITQQIKKILYITVIMSMILGCETGIQNKNEHKGEFGEIDHTPNKTVEHKSYQATPQKTVQKSYQQISNAKKIFSNAAIPGYYLQIDVFKQSKPDKYYLGRLNRSPFNYYVLQKYDTFYALVGPYKSYNQAHAQKGAVKSKLGKDSFVIQVLRP